MIITISFLDNPFEVRNPISSIFITSPSISKTSPTFVEPSINKIIPEIKSLKVCCKPIPIPTKRAADPAKSTVTLIPKALNIMEMEITQITYFTI